MSLVSGIRGFSVSMYGQSGVVMDWFGLNDPFTQQTPLKITNTYSGTLWFQGALINPRSGYYNYSGIQMGNVGSGASATLVMTWDAGVSGWITGSSPITDTLTLNLTTFTSSNYTGSYSSGNFTVPNTLFNRYSGVIKVFGDIYSNDQPTPSLSAATGGTLSQSGTYSYAISYVLSGWESDVGAGGSPAGAAITLTSGFGSVAVSWTAIASATQYYVWRWSGSADFTVSLGAGLSATLSGAMDLVNVTTTNSYTDTGTQLRTGFYRHRNWEGGTGINLASPNLTTYLSAPQARTMIVNGAINVHSYYLQRNTSGTSFLGPFYMTFHHRTPTTAAFSIALATGAGVVISGQTIADSQALSAQLANVWFRECILLGASGTLSSSGLVHVQVELVGNNEPVLDDVFVVAVS